jgi:hypothetical protein
MIRKWIADLVNRIDWATRPRNPELEYGSKETVDATAAVQEKGQPIRILTD